MESKRVGQMISFIRPALWLREMLDRLSDPKCLPSYLRRKQVRSKLGLSNFSVSGSRTLPAICCRPPGLPYLSPAHPWGPFQLCGQCQYCTALPCRCGRGSCRPCSYMVAAQGLHAALGPPVGKSYCCAFLTGLS